MARMTPMARMTGQLIYAALVAGACVGCGKSTEPAATAGGDGAAPAGVAAGAAAESAPQAPAVPVVREVSIPDGTALRLDLATPVASDTSNVEDVVRATLRAAVTVNGTTVLPAGAELSGIVTDVERSGRVKGRARVAYRFTSVRNGADRYTIQTAPIVHEAQGTKREDAKKIGIGAGIGAAVGAVIGGGDGAAKGAAIGGAGGTGVVLSTRGKEVRLGAGANVTTHLTAPLKVQVE